MPIAPRRPSARSMMIPAAALAATVLAAEAGDTVCDSIGPDIIVGEITSLVNYDPVGGIDAIAIGTTSCNIGDEVVVWISSTNEHPVIAQHMYRLKDGRFEQIGQSWLKHGFGALQENACGCGCIPADFSHLGVGCSDPYTANTNGNQFRLGPKFEVNPATGEFPYPFTGIGQTGNDIFKRLQVHLTDLDPALNAGAEYFVESQYVHPDDAAAGNGLNNASWRPVTVWAVPENAHVALAGTTHRERPAVYAWAEQDPAVRIQTIDVPGDGRFHLAWKAADIGGGQWDYEFALHNLTSDRAAGVFTVPLPAGTTAGSTGFHDVDYHSGEPFDDADWSMTVSATGIQWATNTYASDVNANAVRWGSLYNFRFTADAGPDVVRHAVIGLFKPGSPTMIDVPLACDADTTGPLGGTPDGNVDALDMLTLIAQWGSPCSAPCTADVTGPGDAPDGNVDSLDFLLLIEQWGSPSDC